MKHCILVVLVLGIVSKPSVNVGRLPRTTLCSDKSTLSDWVVEGLEDDEGSITSSSATRAGENDVLPLGGLCIGNVWVCQQGYQGLTKSPPRVLTGMRRMMDNDSLGFYET